MTNILEEKTKNEDLTHARWFLVKKKQSVQLLGCGHYYPPSCTRMDLCKATKDLNKYLFQARIQNSGRAFLALLFLISLLRIFRTAMGEL